MAIKYYIERKLVSKNEWVLWTRVEDYTTSALILEELLESAQQDKRYSSIRLVKVKTKTKILKEVKVT